MLTRTRLAAFSLFFALLLFAFPAGAQIHGVPPSVTSFGFGGSNNPTPGTPASVTSLGPLGWDCCSGPFIAPPFRPDFNRHHFRNHQLPVGEMTPAVIPYFVPYPVPYENYTEDEYSPATDRTYSRGVSQVYEHGPWYQPEAVPRHQPLETPSVGEERVPMVSPGPGIEVAPQPATVLVYKDGHKQEVQNYAIFGDTLFDFTGDRSHKIQLADLDLAATRRTNDDRGVEFRVPGEKDPGQ